MAAHRIDLAGQRFGRLVAQRPQEARENRRVLWHCQCDCGKTRIVPAGTLKSGQVLHCGCQTGAHRRARNLHHGNFYDARLAAKKHTKKNQAAQRAKPVTRPNNGPLDVFLYAHRAPT